MPPFSLLESIAPSNFSPAKPSIDGSQHGADAVPKQLDAGQVEFTYATDLKEVPAFNSAEHWAQRTTTDHSTQI